MYNRYIYILVYYLNFVKLSIMLIKNGSHSTSDMQRSQLKQWFGASRSAKQLAAAYRLIIYIYTCKYIHVYVNIYICMYIIYIYIYKYI